MRNLKYTQYSTVQYIQCSTVHTVHYSTFQYRIQYILEHRTVEYRVSTVQSTELNAMGTFYLEDPILI